MTTATYEGRYRSRVDDEPRLEAREDPVVWGARSGPYSDQALEEYARRGFLQLDDLFAAREVAALEMAVNDLVNRDDLRGRREVIREPASDEVRSVFAVHRFSAALRTLADDDRLVDRARQVLGSDVYLHQSRINLKPAFRGRDFYWHSDFETWHVEDGMPHMRAVSFSIQLNENRHDNGSLMIVPGSHRRFIGCVGGTPERNYEQSLRSQQLGVPDDETLTELIAEHGIATIVGGSGSTVMFDSNCMHGSNSNITPFPRTNIFLVYNSVENRLGQPFSGQPPRPSYIAER
jgi:ectoine hydroxylase